jgi:hypothetical protein
MLCNDNAYGMTTGWLTGWLTTDTVSADSRNARVDELRELILENKGMLQLLASAGRDARDARVLGRWLSASGWDVKAALQSLEAHSRWIQQNSEILPIIKIDVERDLASELQQRKLFLQVREHLEAWRGWDT